MGPDSNLTSNCMSGETPCTRCEYSGVSSDPSLPVGFLCLTVCSVMVSIIVKMCVCKAWSCPSWLPPRRCWAHSTAINFHDKWGCWALCSIGRLASSFPSSYGPPSYEIIWLRVHWVTVKGPSQYALSVSGTSLFFSPHPFYDSLTVSVLSLLAGWARP